MVRNMAWKTRLCRGCKNELVWCDTPETAVCDDCKKKGLQTFAKIAKDFVKKKR